MTITNKKQRTHTETDDPHWIEWVTGLLSSLLVIALLIWIGREALLANSRPPELSVKTRQIEQVGSMFRVDISLDNTGPNTAAAVRVVGEIISPTGEVEEAEVTFDYAPAESQTNGALYFRSDPRAGRLVVFPSGFTEP